MRASSPTFRRGFSLAELLLVLAIIGVMTVLVIPNLAGLFGASAITRSGQIVEDNLKIANEYALAHRCAVEVRFYNYNGAYQAMQLFQISDQLATGQSYYQFTAITKVVTLPPPVQMITTSNYSTLLGTSQLPGASSYAAPSAYPAIPQAGSGYTYTRFAFRPDGSTDLPAASGPTGLYYLTLAAPTPSPPVNFYTISVDYQNGKVRSFRP